jgi:hypothetical protein
MPKNQTLPLINQSSPDGVRAAFTNQFAYCSANDAPITAAICQTLSQVLDNDTAFGRAVLNWQGMPMADALPLRCAAAFHALYQAGNQPELASLYQGQQAVPADINQLIAHAIARHDSDLLPWLETPPQTNESGRSSNFAAAMLWLAEQGLPTTFHLSEIGSSAGVNLMMDQYRYDLGGTNVGPETAAIHFSPEWQGDAPPQHDITIGSTRGVDLNPLDLTNPAHAARLKAYIWPENLDRFDRMEAAIALANTRSLDLDEGDAADFVDAALAQPQSPDTTHVLMHSIVWVYLPEETQQHITAAMEAAGAKATSDTPLAWIMLESNRDTLRHELKVRYWPDNSDKEEKWHWLGEAHAHGKWIRWQPE